MLQEEPEFWRLFQADRAREAMALPCARQAIEAMEQKNWSVLSLAVTEQLQACVQALWTPQTALKGHDGLSIWHIALKYGSPETIQWMGKKIQEDGLGAALGVPSATGITPLMCAAVNTPQALRTALPWMQAEDFWRSDAGGANALDWAFARMPMLAASLEESACLLLSAADALPKDTPQAKKEWMDWLHLALDVQSRDSMDFKLFWLAKKAAQEHQELTQHVLGALSLNRPGLGLVGAGDSESDTGGSEPAIKRRSVNRL